MKTQLYRTYSRLKSTFLAREVSLYVLLLCNPTAEESAPLWVSPILFNLRGRRHVRSITHLLEVAQ